MNIKELIDQIGGRERLEFLSEYRPNVVKGQVTFREVKAMARALLAVLDAKPLGYIDPESMREYRGVMAGGSWSATPRTGEYNQTMPIYTTPPAPSVPDGWKLVPIEPTQRMIDAHTEGMVSSGATRAYRAMLAAAPAPGGDDVKQG